MAPFSPSGQAFGITLIPGGTNDLGATPVRDVGLLEAAAARPRTSVFGEDAYPSIFGKAAALLHSNCQNHALVDGNKRLAWLATDVFLRINDTVIEMTDEDAFELVMRVAANHVEVDDIAAVLEQAQRS